MKKDERDLVEVLKAELEFIERGGYARCLGESWRPPLVFEDSPSCANFCCRENQVACEDCVLAQLVPPELRSAKFPCRHIPLNAAGETLNSLYQYGDQKEIESTVMSWLKEMIANLEARRGGPAPEPWGEFQQESEMSRGIALHGSDQPRCANPACHTKFHWLAGGKFFRFRPTEARGSSSPTTIHNPAAAADHAPSNTHGVRHYWLCEPCSHMFTLVYHEEAGVVLKLRQFERPAIEILKRTSAA